MVESILTGEMGGGCWLHSSNLPANKDQILENLYLVHTLAELILMNLPITLSKMRSGGGLCDVDAIYQWYTVIILVEMVYIVLTLSFSPSKLKRD